MLPIAELIEAKNELIKVSNELLSKWRNWREGGSWQSRTSRMEAAHTIIVLEAFFSATSALNLPFRFADLYLSRAEKDAIRVSIDSPIQPTPEVPFEKVKTTLKSYYRELGVQLREFLEGLAIWDNLTSSQQEHATRQLLKVLPEAAVRRYEDRYRQLMVDVPEFAFWAGMIDQQATRAGLSSLKQLLSEAASGRVLPEQLEVLAKTQQAILQRPVVEGGDIPLGMRLPTLSQAYMSPRFRVARVSEGENPSLEQWWDKQQKIRGDFSGFLAGYFTTSQAASGPLIVLGQPGAGKSVLTKVLSAHLPSDFLAIRVPLRDVSANGDVQVQIEEAIYQATGERLQWPALARSTAGALPVVLLDGFDELLQATGVRQSDYLNRVVRFQERERDAGRSVAVIVTSRTAVVDRAEIPKDSILVRLEPFSEEQVAQWLEIWNASNAEYFARSGVRPLTPSLVLQQPHLAEQPLLLLMLALYDANENALEQTSDQLGQAELYERLMRSFATRELQKEHTSNQVSARVEDELLLLSVVAFAMFNRGRQWVSAEEVTVDLNALFPRPQVTDTSFDTPLSAGERAFGRFFFVHRSQAKRDNDLLQSYEFLHATFGEFLIARLIHSVLQEMASRATSLLGTEVKDESLRTLLSWALISARAPILSFLRDFLHGMHPTERDRQCRLILEAFRKLDTHHNYPSPSYRPSKSTPPRIFAQYSANLLLIALTLSSQLYASDFIHDAEEVVPEWHRWSLLWQSQVTSEEWASLVNGVEVTPVWRNDGQDVQLRLTEEWNPDPVDIFWLGGVNKQDSIVGWNHGQAWGSRLRREIAFTCSQDASLMLHSLEPLLLQNSSFVGVLDRASSKADTLKSVTHRLLWLLASKDKNSELRALTYAGLIEADVPGDNEAGIYNALAADLATFEDVHAKEILESAATYVHKENRAILVELAKAHGIEEIVDLRGPASNAD